MKMLLEGEQRTTRNGKDDVGSTVVGNVNAERYVVGGKRLTQSARSRERRSVQTDHGLRVRLSSRRYGSKERPTQRTRGGRSTGDEEVLKALMRQRKKVGSGEASSSKIVF